MSLAYRYLREGNCKKYIMLLELHEKLKESGEELLELF